MQQCRSSVDIALLVEPVEFGAVFFVSVALRQTFAMSTRYRFFRVYPPHGILLR